MFCYILQDALTKQYADLLPSLADLARNLVRDLDPQVRAVLICRRNMRENIHYFNFSSLKWNVKSMLRCIVVVFQPLPRMLHALQLK